MQIHVTFLPPGTGVYSHTEKEGVSRLGIIFKGSKLLEKLWCCVGAGLKDIFKGDPIVYKKLCIK